VHERHWSRLGSCLHSFGDSLYTPDVDFVVIDRATEVAATRGLPTAQVALAWLLHKPGVTAPIVGAAKPEHLDDAIAAEKLSLDAEGIARLEEPYIPHAVSKHSGVREQITVDQPTAALPRPLSERSS
jgi:predicted oxidoreductase